MQRKKPFSAKQKKAQLQQKRAVKRGDISPPPPSKPDHRKKKSHKGPAQHPPATATGATSFRRENAADSSRRLQSSFVKLPQRFLEHTRRLASTLQLQRPIQSEAAILPTGLSASQKADSGLDQENSSRLTCPKRPKWRYDMTKKEVEKNEEGLFKKWIDQTDEIVGEWCNEFANGSSNSPPDGSGHTAEESAMPHAPTSFERNLEVWRQLWRVTEISQILLILLDSRCPLLHFPPSLSVYLSSPHIANHTRIILVLTKVDITGPARTDEWTRFLKGKYPGTPVVHVESYVEVPGGEGSRRGKHVPQIPLVFRESLVQALETVHSELLHPPLSVRDNPERLKHWRPSVRTNISWDAVLHAEGGQVGTVVGGPALPRSHTATATPGADVDTSGDADVEGSQGHAVEGGGVAAAGVEPEFLTIGLIGQPNVGKSSLLNALFGTTKVSASRTPGKTKHFQTLFWTTEVRLVDCPGLVMPNLVPMETQVLSGILPISRVSAIPLCIHYAAQLLPLERIFALTHPSLNEMPVPDKRTWREPRVQTSSSATGEEPKWTGMDILTAYALKKGWVTAKAGRPDVNRAGNAILRLLAEGRIRWGFWPEGTPTTRMNETSTSGYGIWIASGGSDHAETHIDEDEYSDQDSEQSDAAPDSEAETDRSQGESGDEDEDEGTIAAPTSASAPAKGGRFAALTLGIDEGGGASSTEEDDED